MNKQPKLFNSTRRASYMLALFWLLLCGIIFWTCINKELSVTKERAGQRLALIAQEDVAQLTSYRHRVLCDAATLSLDPLLAAAVGAYITDGQQEELVRARLQFLGQQGNYRSILLLDSAGILRLRIAAAETRAAVDIEQFSQTSPDFQPSLVALNDVRQNYPPLLGGVAPLIHVDRRHDQILAKVVLLSDFPRLRAAGSDAAGSVSQQLIVAPKQSQLLLLEEGKRLPESIFSREDLVTAALRGEATVVRGVDYLGRDSLAVSLHVPDSDWSVLVVQPVSALIQLRNFRATGVLLFCWLAGSLVFFRGHVRRRRHLEAMAQSRDFQHRLQQQQHNLLHNIHDGILVVDGKNVIQEINPVACRLSGWSREEALGRAVDVVISLIDDKSATLITREGKALSLALKIAPSADDGAGERILIFRDRSEESLVQQRVESRLLLREFAYTHGVHELLHRAMQELATLVASPRGFCCSLDIPLCAVAVEQPVQTGQGKSWSWYDAEGEPICSSLQEWLPDFPPEVLVVEPPLAGDQAQPQEPGASQEQECRFGRMREILLPLHRAGRLAAMMVIADKPGPYTTADVDTVVQMGEYIWRLVEQKQMEEALLASERRYRTLYSSMMDAFVVTDLSGRIRECNQAYAGMLGFTPEELKGAVARDFTPEKWREYEQEHVRKQLMHGGCSDLYEKEYRHRDGRIFPVELRTYLLVNNEGQPEGMSAVVRDISRRKQIQEEQEKLRDRLNLAQKLESVGQLAGGVAHDFNNMLSVIIGFAELALRRMEVPEPLDMYLKEIVTAAKRSADVTRQLLVFARQQAIAPKVLDFNATLEGMLRMLRRLIGENVELSWMPGKEIWPVRMDPTQIDQLLANLCVNARDAIGGVGKITIETDRVSFDEAYCSERGGFIPGDFVVLAVSDTGGGIDRAILDKIFEPFFTTKAVGQGTGLGLATVYGIVKQNQGFINVYSEPDHGTTFRVYLPRYQGKAEQCVGCDSQSCPMGQGELILVVEDEPAMLTLNQTLLEQLNYKVLTASRPGKALMVAREYGRAIDLVMIDVIMPEMNGRDLATAIAEFCPKAKVLFVSGYTANVIIHRGELEEGTSFLTKPFSTGELACKVRETLMG
ncbi:MAG: PAS domain S-box protein [Desulfobulbus sp.]|nr:PAS domain S-box protein [Desulfobulbus sp.]